MNLPAYLFGALRHAAARLAGRGRKRPSSEAHHDRRGRRIDSDLSDWLDRALATLPPERREVVTLKVDGGLTFEEVAAVLGVSANTAASRYRYALDNFRHTSRRGLHASRPTSAEQA